MAAGFDLSKNSRLPETPTRQACSTCRYRKTRCDRVEPKCGRCVRLRLPCDYNIPARPAREDVERQLRELQDRLARAEVRLAQSGSQPCCHPTTAGASQAQTLSASTVDELMSGFLPGEDDQLFPGMVEDGPNFGLGAASGPTPNYGLPPWLSPELSLPTEPCFVFPNSNSGFSSNDSGGEAVSPKVLADLHRNYFDVVYFAFPFLSENRFAEALATNSEHRPLIALSYSVALIGCGLSLTGKRMQQTCYNMARQYVELCERDEEESNIASLDLFQALLLIIRHEIDSKRLTRAFLTVGRAIRLSKILSLHQIDQQAGPSSHLTVASDVALPPTQSQVILEERRRSFWALYILESYLSTRTGIPCELGDATAFQVRLPSPGVLGPSLASVQMPFLSELLRGQHDILSPANMSSYASCVLMVELALRCFDHGRKLELESEGFWDSHYGLVKAIDERTALMQSHLNANSVRVDPVAFSMHMNLCAADIFFHQAAIKKIERQGLSQKMSTENQERSMAMALKIASAVRLNWTSPGPISDIFKLQATFIAWPLTMAIGSLSRNLVSLDPKEAASMGVANSLRLLLAAMDQIEEPGGHWHSLTVGAAKTLQQWDEKSGFESEVL